MSGENEDLLYESAGGLFPDLTDNGDELDFTKDFFSDNIPESNDLNGTSYENMEAGDLISELDVQDVFSRLGPLEGDEGTSTFGEVNLENSVPLSNLAPKKPFANGQKLPTYGSFQKPSINLPHMSSGNFGASVPGMYMQRNGGHGSPTSPAALSSSGLLSPGATSEKLNSLSLEHHHQMGYSPYRQSAYDVKGNMPRGFPKAGPYSPSGGVVMHGAGGVGDQRYPTASLPAPCVSAQPNSDGISLFTSAPGGRDMAGGMIASVSDVMHSSPANPVTHSPDGVSPRSLSNTSADAKESGVDGMLVSTVDGTLNFQQNKPLFLSSPGLAHRLASAVDSSGFVDASGDTLRPLPHPARTSAMQRSYSSHALGQLRHMAPITQLSGEQSPGVSRIGSSDALPSRFSNESGSAHMPSQLTEMQSNAHIRPLMQSMRRVHSTGDIQKLNGLAGGGSSPSAIDRSNYEDGGFKIGRYTMEERKIRIHRYQQKRTQRNFNKKIKYACRKTLADSRPRVRGRFAKNDEVGEAPAKLENKDEEEEDNSMYEDEEFFVDEESSGDLSEALGINGGKEHHQGDSKQLLSN